MEQESIMEIVIAIVVLVVIFFIFQATKAVNINKLCFSQFPIWLKKYIYSAPNSIDKATLARSLIDQVIILARELNAFKKEEYQEICIGLKGLGPEESIQLVDGWIERFLPVLEDIAGKAVIETSSARYLGTLMLIAATSVNPHGTLRDFLGRQPSNRRL